MRVGIVGAGWIAEKAAITLKDLEGVDCYAIASRTLEKAEAFARQWQVERSYGSYSELLDDPQVDLVYVATPHSHHYDVTRQAILRGKACLVEKAFMANYAQSKAILDLAHERKVFVAEAIWTRYQPALNMVRQLIDEGRIGQPRLITATLGYSMGDKPRIMRADLCGGALLDLGVYAINFVSMFCDSPIEDMKSLCMKSATGMDLTNTISFRLANGVVANVQSSACCVGDNIGVIAGTEGNIIIDNINNPQLITLNGPDRTFVQKVAVPKQITGYEYQFSACKRALEEGLLEPPQMPHDETLRIMGLMDELRRQWGVVYPMDGVEYGNEE
ncbi:MAG: Gfo/Idh/MocA family oxidoreductase [Prevotella sp.]|nr:Gfo/Idh/MocA family oxidoreductase [Prevotella sp.]